MNIFVFVNVDFFTFYIVEIKLINCYERNLEMNNNFEQNSDITIFRVYLLC